MARSARHTPARRRVARIDTCQAEFDVAAPRGPFSAPETLLTTIRQELLPALSEVLDAPEWQQVQIDAPLIEIDLGDWPEEPTWSDVRYVLALKLRQALSAYATLDQGGDTRHDLKRRSAYDAVKYVSDGSAGTSASANTAQPLTGGSEDEPRTDVQKFRQPEGSTLRDPQRAPYDLTHDGAEEPASTSPPTNAALPLTGEPEGNAQAGSTKQSKPALPTDALEGQSTSVPSDKDNAQHGGFDTTEPAAYEKREFARPPASIRDATPTRSVTDTDLARLRDAETSAALLAFAKWLGAAEAPPTDADILSYIAARAHLREALVIWHAADPATQQKAMTLGAPERTRVLPLVAHLRAEAERSDQSSSKALQATSPVGSEESIAQSASPVAPPSGATLGKVPDNEAILAALDQVLSTEGETETAALRHAIEQLASAFHASGWTIETARRQSQWLVAHLLATPRAKTASEVQRNATVSAAHQNQYAQPETAAMHPKGLAKRDANPRRADVHRDRPDTVVGSEGFLEKTPVTPGSDRPLDRHPSHALSAPDESGRSAGKELPPGADPRHPVQDSDTALRSLAAVLGIADKDRADSQMDLRGVVTQRVTQDPKGSFDRLRGNPGMLSQFASLLVGPGIVQSVLFGPKKLGAMQLKALHAAHPAVLHLVLDETPPAHVWTLIQHLLPPRADLLRSRIEALERTARHPELAMQAVALALLEERSLDFETLQETGRAKQDDSVQGDPELQPSKAADGLDTRNARVLEGTATPQPGTEPSVTPPISSEVPSTLDAASLGSSRDLDALLERDSTPLDVFLLFSGLTLDEIAQVTGTQEDAVEGKAARHTQDGDRGQAVSADTRKGGRSKADTSNAKNEGRMHKGQGQSVDDRDLAPTAAPRSEQELFDHLQTLAQSTATASTERLRDMLHLLWSMWSDGPESKATSGQTGPEFPPLLAQIAAQMFPEATPLAVSLENAFPYLEPDPDKRVYRVRRALARLSHLTGSDPTGLIADTKGALNLVLTHATASQADLTQKTEEIPATSPQSLEPVEFQTDSSRYAADASHNTGEETLRITETAGLVLLHPYYKLLFERLKIEHDKQALRQEHVPRALGVLQYLAGTTVHDDPLFSVLLGRDPMLPLPDASRPEPDAQILMEGLLRSIIDNWGKLGATSPDGLRQTFIQRTGSVRFDTAGAWLRVAPGPFDMLLDSLPWRLSPVALPWMPLPCFVSWREDEDA